VVARHRTSADDEPLVTDGPFTETKEICLSG
jgi:hypothetical protein